MGMVVPAGNLDKIPPLGRSGSAMRTKATGPPNCQFGTSWDAATAPVEYPTTVTGFEVDGLLATIAEWIPCWPAFTDSSPLGAPAPSIKPSLAGYWTKIWLAPVAEVRCVHVVGLVQGVGSYWLLPESCCAIRVPESG